MAVTSNNAGTVSESKIESLERERDELARENAAKKEEIKKLRNEIGDLKSDGDAAEAIAARAVELESEVVRLQHDVTLEITAAEEARSEVAELRKVLDEKETRVEILEREVKGLKQANAESEMKVRDLERKLSVTEINECEERSKRVRAEEEVKEKVGEKEREIETLKQKIKEFENVIMGKKIELEKCVKEKIKLEEKIRVMELGILELKEEAESLRNGTKEKEINGDVNIDGEGNEVEFAWPVVAAGSGAIAVMGAIFYFYFGKRR